MPFKRTGADGAVALCPADPGLGLLLPSRVRTFESDYLLGRNVSGAHRRDHLVPLPGIYSEIQGTSKDIDVTPGEPSGCDRDPIRGIRIGASAQKPLSLTVTIDLAEHVAACCVNADNAFVEFQGPAGRVRSGFEFRESRPGHHFTAAVTLPGFGAYSYRIVASVLGHPLNREGSFEVPQASQS